MEESRKMKKQEKKLRQKEKKIASKKDDELDRESVVDNIQSLDLNDNFNASTEDIVKAGDKDHDTDTEKASDFSKSGCSEYPIELFDRAVNEDYYKGAENESLSSENSNKQFEARNEVLDMNAEEVKELLDDSIRRD